jgi:hypothetical protein
MPPNATQTATKVAHFEPEELQTISHGAVNLFTRHQNAQPSKQSFHSSLAINTRSLANNDMIPTENAVAITLKTSFVRRILTPLARVWE